MKNVIVTGGGGFIGKYVAKALHQSGCNVFVIDRMPVSEEYVADSLVGDIGSDDFAKLAFAHYKNLEIDGIVHLAADIRMNESESLIRTNCLGSLNMGRLAEELKVQKFVYLSSVPVIGTPKEIPINENHPVQPLSLYHTTKYAGELIVRDLMQAGIDWVILRICSPVGRREKQVAYLGFLLNTLLAGNPVHVFGKGSRVQNYIDVRDVASAVSLSLQKGSGLYLIGGSSVSNLELAELCKDLTCSSSEIVIGTQTDPEDDLCWTIDGTKAETELNYKPAYTIEDTIRWILGESE